MGSSSNNDNPTSLFQERNFRLRLLIIAVIVLLLHQIKGSRGQQTYVNNKQLDCEKNYTVTDGYVCNSGSGEASSCLSYLTFRSSPPYNSPATIGYLLNADPSEIARINNISSDIANIPTDTLIIVPANCSCLHSNNTTSTTGGGGGYYQHNASYALRTTSETYFSVSNNTYEGLTTCQSLIAQNPYNSRSLAVGMKLVTPLRCACPTSNQSDAGVRYLLIYLINWGDTVDYIGHIFGVDNQSINYANQFSSSSIIFPFTPIIVPLKTEPTKIDTTTAVPPPPRLAPELPAVSVGKQGFSSKQRVFIGAGIGGAVLLLVAFTRFLFCFLRRRHGQRGESVLDTRKAYESSDYTEVTINSKPCPVSPEGVRYAIGSLTVYKFEELQQATGFFDEANRIKGSSVYRGSLKGDEAAIKVMKGDVSYEMNILKQINHSNIIRLSGFCLHDDNTYLVYEYAENGSLSDWLLLQSKIDDDKSRSGGIGWKQRVQIAYDVADALNYLHNYISPPCIHKNLKSSNVLVDADLRAKVANFGLARRTVLPDEEEELLLQLTRHVVGTYGYMAPEYIENGLVTPKLDVYAFGVVLLELLTGRETAAAIKKKNDTNGKGEKEEELLFASIGMVLGGENVREKLRDFIDPCLGNDEYPMDLAYSLAQLANNCVTYDLNSRPTMSAVFITLSKILSSSMDWDPSHELDLYSTLSRGR